MLGQEPPKDVLDKFKKECLKTCMHHLSWPPNHDLHRICMDKCINDKIKQWQEEYVPPSPPLSPGEPPSLEEEKKLGIFSGMGITPGVAIAVGVSALALMYIIYALIKKGR